MDITKLIEMLTAARDAGIRTVTTTDDAEPYLLAIDGQIVLGSQEACAEYAENLQ